MTSWDMPLSRLPYLKIEWASDIYKEFKVNIKVLQWLLKHRDVETQGVVSSRPFGVLDWD